MSTTNALADENSPLPRRMSRSGGREASHPHQSSLDSLQPADDNDSYYLHPPETAKLTIVQITDVYTLDNFASLRTMLQTIRERQGPNGKVLSMLTGDFLSPYLLSSIDRGQGMMDALRETPIDILTWGNHEADIDHRTVCRHVQEWPGIWLNSNMPSHEAMDQQVPYHIVQVSSPDGSVTRKIGFVAVLSNDPKLYASCRQPGGAFGGAKIEDPWETLREYEAILRTQRGCDLVIPLEHLYVPENTRTCREFDCFPLILSGHDHHRIDQVLHGTRLIKPGMDGVHAAVIEISWETAYASSPTIRNSFVPVANFSPDPELQQQTNAAYNVLAPLRNTELARVLPRFRPLSSKNARGSVCTMGRLLCGMIKASLQQRARSSLVDRKMIVDGVILMGGNVRGGEEYPDDSFFSLEMLEAEVKADEVIGIVPIPGYVLATGIEATHQGGPKPGWMQLDNGIELNPAGKVVRVAGAPLEPTRDYRIATKISDLTNGQSLPLKEYFETRPDLLPLKGDYINVQTELMGFFARNMFRKLWKATGQHLEERTVSSSEATEEQLRLNVLDRNGDGTVSVSDIHTCLRDYLGLRISPEEMTLARYVHGYADATGNGVVTVQDFAVFCGSDDSSLPEEFQPLPSRNWTKAFPEPVPSGNCSYTVDL